MQCTTNHSLTVALLHRMPASALNLECAVTSSFLTGFAQSENISLYTMGLLSLKFSSLSSNMIFNFF